MDLLASTLCTQSSRSMVRIHHGASVIAMALGNNWEPFLFCVLKSVLKPEAKQRLVITSLATLVTVLLFGLVSYALR